MNDNISEEDVKPMTMEEASDFLNISKSTLYKMTSQRAIPHYKRGKKIYFSRQELVKWVYQNRVRTVDEIDEQAIGYVLNRST